MYAAPHKQWFTYHLKYFCSVPHVPSWYSSVTLLFLYIFFYFITRVEILHISIINILELVVTRVCNYNILSLCFL